MAQVTIRLWSTERLDSEVILRSPDKITASVYDKKVNEFDQATRGGAMFRMQGEDGRVVGVASRLLTSCTITFEGDD